MEFEVTGKSKGFNLTELFLKKEAAGKNAKMSFAELAAAKSAEGSAEQPYVSEGTKTGLFMGETYEERLNKIGDKNSANAFRDAYAKKMAGSVDYISAVSQLFNTGYVGADNFADAFPQYDVITHVGNADIASANWQRNDFPFWEYFQRDTSADALNGWRPTGENPPQTRGDLQRSYGSIGPGRIAILIPESLQKKMDADPAYARKIVAKLREWKEDYDRWDNTVAASYGGNVAEHQASKSYVFDLDENGDVRNCTVTSSGGELTGPTDEERRQFKAEQERKWKLRVKYVKIMEDSANNKIQKEQEALRFFQSQRIKQEVLL